MEMRLHLPTHQPNRGCLHGHLLPVRRRPSSSSPWGRELLSPVRSCRTLGSGQPLPVPPRVTAPVPPFGDLPPPATAAPSCHPAMVDLGPHRCLWPPWWGVKQHPPPTPRPSDIWNISNSSHPFLFLGGEGGGYPSASRTSPLQGCWGADDLHGGERCPAAKLGSPRPSLWQSA